MQRVRTLFYRHLVQRPLTPGLLWFTRTYARLGAPRGPLTRASQLRLAAQGCGQEQGLRSLEVRVCGGDSFRETYNDLKAIHEAARTALAPPCEFGVLVHLARSRGPAWDQGQPAAGGRGSVADPTGSSGPAPPGPGMRYARYYRQQRQIARTVVWCLEYYPALLRTVRGIDLCADELAVPSWVTAPLVHYLRRAGDRAASLLWQQAGELVPGLRCTLHAGEDCLHLLGGLRRIGEYLTRFGLQSGDRLGHGVVLGLSPQLWAEQVGRLALPREERLFDLLWERSCYARGLCQPPAHRVVQLDQELVLLSRALFDRTLDPARLEQLVDGLHHEALLRRCHFPDATSSYLGRRIGPLPDPCRVEELVARWLADPELFRRGQVPIWVDPRGEVEVLERLQDGLRSRVAELGLTVEVNPSSNLLIGHLGDLQGHPLWRLSAPNRDDALTPVSISLGSDDPMTFATNLPAEYQLLHDTLRLAGISEPQTHRWLEEVREAGLSSRFSIPRQAAPVLQPVVGPWLPIGDPP